MAINFSRYNDIPLYSSDRQVHLAANGCLTFTPDTPEMDTIFSNDEMVFFKNFDELRERIQHYARHIEAARKIAEAGRKRALRDYECKTVTARMMAGLAGH
jgi:spore maturation protein CgeB